MYQRKTDRTSHNRSPEPFLRDDVSAHPELCRVAGCDRSPWCRGTCKSHYNHMQPGRPWAHKAAAILAPVNGYAPTPADQIEDIRASFNNLRAHLVEIDTVLNGSGVPLVVGDAMPGDRLARVRWLTDRLLQGRVRTLEPRPSAEVPNGR